MGLSRYRVVPGPAGSPYPDWFPVDGESGVYVLRAVSDGRVLYVGESHSGRLRSTITRHFQRWTGPTSGPVYGRGTVEIAFELLPDEYAEDRQADLISRLDPRDNVYLRDDDDDDIPF